MALDPAIRDHQAWLGYLQPDGLVVSPTALVDLQVILPRDTIQLQERFLEWVSEISVGEDTTSIGVGDFALFVEEFLGWPRDLLHGLSPEQPLPDSVNVYLKNFGETLAPTFVFADPKPIDSETPWLLFVQIVENGAPLDKPQADDAKAWSASSAQKFERLLRECRVPIGILTNCTDIRLMYAPRGENTGSITFPVGAMTEIAGRPILAAFHLLLRKSRLLTGPMESRLSGILTRSRAYQATVSIKLAEQVLDALYELVRGFQAADERVGGALLRTLLAKNPDDIYAGLLTVLMRLVFLLYAEDRGVMPASALYAQNYSVHGLFEKLRTDAEHYPDTMHHRFGSWARLLALFRAVHDGCRHQELATPTRRGYLFDPKRFPFLVGETLEEPRVPLVADGVVCRVLEKLLLLDGERLSYRTLDVEQIGSVYETMMGFRLTVAGGPAIAIKPAKRYGAPVAINLNDLLSLPGPNRSKWFAERTDQKVTGEVERSLRVASTVDALLAALEKKIARSATPHPVAAGGMILQPSDERRRSGSHYTPPSLTRPIVETTLRPVLTKLGEAPTPKQILDLKVCDIAVGSGAFLVETCRQLGEELVNAWHTHDQLPTIPADEDLLLYARRLVAQRCLYGVDRNPMAADLAKLSLWLVTLAKDHPFTFLDHAIRCGDSIVGLTKDQIVEFHWREMDHRVLGQEIVESRILSAFSCRKELLEADEDLVAPELKRQKLDVADSTLKEVREAGDLVFAAFFGADKDRDRISLRDRHLRKYNESFNAPAKMVTEVDDICRNLRKGERPVVPFHWQIEFPEVFDRDNPGFDAIIGNPPFLGGRRVREALGGRYFDWLSTVHSESSGNADLAAHFFRRAFDLLRRNGTFGLIATNTISQGDTRATGLRWICNNSGTIFSARKRVKWPGQAAVVVSVVSVVKGKVSEPYDLDGRQVPTITAYLFHAGGHESPSTLRANAGKSFQGSIVLGKGFTFDDTDTKGASNPISLMYELVATNPHNAERILPFIGGEEVNESPIHAHHRYVINFGDMTEEDAWRWPDLMRIVEEKVKPERTRKNKNGEFVLRSPLPQRWWHYADKRPALVSALMTVKRVLALSQTSKYLSIAFLPTNFVFSHKLVVIAQESWQFFAVMQSRVHSEWADFMGSSMKDDPVYTPSDCFETFPFPANLETYLALEQVGQMYYEFRAVLMVSNNEGLTKTYNRFHEPQEFDPDIVRLRELHAMMDRVVLDSYGWNDISISCQFILDYDDEVDEEEGSRRRKKPWRYRWPDEVRDEVLARLLKLNHQRAEEERATSVEKPKKLVKRAVRPKTNLEQASLFDFVNEVTPSPSEVMASSSDVSAPTTLPDGVWARPAIDSSAGIESILAAVLKRLDGPVPALHVRLAALLASEPRLLTTALAGDEAILWIRLVGPEAEPVPDGVLPFVPRADQAWGNALRQLHGNGHLVVDMAADTWAPGEGLDAYYTEGWPDGRAQMVLAMLSKRNLVEIVQRLPHELQRWIHDKAA